MNYLQRLARLPRALTLYDKLSLAGLLLIILTASFFWWQTITEGWLLKPVKGGIYTEGLITQNPYELDLIDAKLTKIGLTYVDHDNKIHGALAERWEITPDGKTYTFFLRPNLPIEEIAQTYRDLPNWQGILIETPDSQTIKMTLKQPFAPLLSFTSDPVVELGPYIQENQTDNELSFTANKNFVLGEPNIQRILLMLYPDERALKAALQRQEVMGADIAIKGISGTNTKTLRLTKRSVLLFNLEKDPFKNKELRQQIIDDRKLDTPLSVSLVTTQDKHLLDLANEFKDKAAKLNLNVSINSVNSVALERDIVPTEDYDLMLTDLNYGYDGDPYPYWHSSQLIPPGLNYAGYNNKEADKLIEQARQTVNDSNRQEKHEAVQRMIESDAAAIFYPYQEYNYTVSNRLKGVSEGIGALPSDRFTEVWQWFIKAKKQPN